MMESQFKMISIAHVPSHRRMVMPDQVSHMQWCLSATIKGEWYRLQILLLWRFNLAHEPLDP